MKIINMNDSVKVKLTDYGKDIYYHQYDYLNHTNDKILIEPHYPNIDENGYTNFQLWTLMQLYGNYITLSGTIENNTLPFETTFILE